VRLIDLAEGDRVVSIAALTEPDDEESTEPAAEPGNEERSEEP
jgi:hypothetical protein